MHLPGPGDLWLLNIPHAHNCQKAPPMLAWEMGAVHCLLSLWLFGGEYQMEDGAVCTCSVMKCHLTGKKA